MLRIIILLTLVSLNYYTLKANTLRIQATGDVMPHSDYHSELPEADLSHLGPLLKEGNPHLVMGNLEGPLTSSTTCSKKLIAGKSYAFRIPPRYAEILKTLGFNVMTLANNHSTDFGVKGLEESRRLLTQVGILPIGSGKTIDTVTINGIPLSLFGISWRQQHLSYLYDENLLLEMIQQEKQKGRVVIISAHGGGEGSKARYIADANETMVGENRGNFYRFCHRAIDSGADLILGHGPHVVRGIKLYKNRLIAFSLGNFLTHGSFNTSGFNQYTLILNLTIDHEGKFQNGNIVPMKQKKLGAEKGVPVYDSTFYTIELLQELSAKIPESGLTISNRGEILPTR